MKRATCKAMVFCFTVAISGCTSTKDDDSQPTPGAGRPNEARDAKAACIREGSESAVVTFTG